MDTSAVNEIRQKLQITGICTRFVLFHSFPTKSRSSRLTFWPWGWRQYATLKRRYILPHHTVSHLRGECRSPLSIWGPQIWRILCSCCWHPVLCCMILLCVIILIIFVKIRNYEISHYIVFCSLVLGCFILLSTLFSKNLNLWFPIGREANFFIHLKKKNMSCMRHFNL